MLAIQLMVSSLPQSPAQLDQHVQLPVAMLPEDAFTTKSLANLLVAQTTNVTHLPTNAKLLFQTVMMVMHVPPTPSTQHLAAFTLQNALQQTNAQSQLALTDNALLLQRTVMTEMFAPSTLALAAPELASTPQSLAHVVLET